MSIRPKFLLVLFGISLIPIMISNGVFFYYTKKNITEDVIYHLQSVASSQHTKLTNIYKQNLERLKSVTSRTQLRISLDKFNRNQKRSDQHKINKIIADAKNVMDSFKAIHIYTLTGTVIASTDVNTIGITRVDNEGYKSGLKKNQATIFARGSDGDLFVYLSGPLYLKDKLLGVVVIESSTENIRSSVTDYTGLGETGETVLAVRNEEGEAVFLMPARFDQSAALNLTISKEQQNIPINYAILGDNKIFTGSVDYRGVPVISVTRHIAGANWGLVVKKDKSEAFSDVSQMRTILLIIILITSLFVIVVAIVMSKQITQPLVYLFNASKRAAEGKLNQQVKVNSNDEIGKLADAFNHMLKTREEYVTELEKTTVELTYATQLKSEFLANMSHELRTPMNSIIGFTSRVIKKAEGQLDERQLKNLRIVIRNAHHLLSLINSLLDLSKIEAGKMEVFPESFELSVMIDEVLSLTRPLFRDKSIDFVVNLPPERIDLYTDNIKLKQSLINLVSNAIKFTQEGNISISARLLNASQDEKKKKVAITVTDTGVGMNDEVEKYIFDAFRQADGSTSRNFGGTGLGLAIVSSFVDLLRGEVNVKSTEGVGTSFEIIIPVNLESSNIVEVEKEPLSDKRLEELSNDKKTMLCIDDEAEVRELISSYLIDEGYQVVTARSAEEGLALAKKIKPFAITLDILMPHKDGWSVLSELKSCEETHNIPVFIISFMDNKALGYQLGAFDFMQKPLNPERLIEGIQKLSNTDIKSVLVVDDDEEARDLMKQILEDVDIICKFAVNGHDALNVLEASGKQLPELILLDLMMPEMDGFELLEQIQKNIFWRKIPVIVITAKTLEEHEQDFLQPRVVSIQTKKELDPKQVLEQLGTVMKSLNEKTNKEQS